MSENNTVTCVYCGHQYPDGTPTTKHELLTEHIKTCEKHPMRDAEHKIKLLREALAGLIGARTKEELDGMELAIRSTPAPDSDKAVMINAIDALRLCITMEVTCDMTNDEQTSDASCCGGNDADAPCAYPSENRPGCLRELRMLAEKAVVAQENDTRTEAEKVEDAVSFILDQRTDGT